MLSNVQVLTPGTRIEQDQDEDKPMQVTVVTLLVNSGTGRAPDAGEHRRQDPARASQPARQGLARRRRASDRPSDGRQAGTGRSRATPRALPETRPEAADRSAPAAGTTVEIIRGDKRSH